MDDKNAAQTMEQTPPDTQTITMRSGCARYTVRMHFSKKSKETLDDKVCSLIRKDIAKGNF